MPWADSSIDPIGGKTMSNEDQNLDRMRQILKRMERSIDDARDRRLREDGQSPGQDHPIGHQNPAADLRASQGSPATQQQPAPSSSPATGPIRFDEDGRPIVGRAKPKNGNTPPQSNNPYSPGSSWR